MNPLRSKTKPAKKSAAAEVTKKVAKSTPTVAAKKVTSSITLKPKISEKSYALADQLNTYMFEVPKSTNKHEVARAVTGQYEVSVVGVRLSAVPGKTQRRYRRGGRSVFKGQRSEIRKAYVTLSEGDKLPIFSAVEEPAKTDKERK